MNKMDALEYINYNYSYFELYYADSHDFRLNIVTMKDGESYESALDRQIMRLADRLGKEAWEENGVKLFGTERAIRDVIEAVKQFEAKAGQ